MKVTLLTHTPNPVELLIFTKQTRLEMEPGLLEKIGSWSPERRAEELAYMARTIRSSWEFIDFTFLFEGVTRSTAQQITRTRTASFAMQSLRVVDASGIPVKNPWESAKGISTEEDNELEATFAEGVDCALGIYAELLLAGASKEDARDILPLGTTCTIAAKYNLRTLVDVVTQRSSLRAQGPYAKIASELKRLVLEAVPEFECFFRDPRDAAFEMLETVAAQLGVTPGSGPAWEIAKAIDLLRKEA